MISAPPPRRAFGDQQPDHEQQHDDGDLCAAAGIAHHQPDIEHAGGQGFDGEKFHRPEIVQRFHQHQRDADDDRRPRHRQRHAAERGPGGTAEGAGGFADARRLFQERRPRQEIDIGVQRHGHDGDRTAERSDFREPVIPSGVPSRQVAQQALNRPRELENVGIDIGDHIGGHRQRQHQRPFEYPSSRKLAHRDQPGGGDADQYGPQRDAGHQFQRVDDVSRQHGVQQMRPDILGRKHRHDDNGHDRQRHQYRDNDGARRPRIQA